MERAGTEEKRIEPREDWMEACFGGFRPNGTATVAERLRRIEALIAKEQEVLQEMAAIVSRKR